MPPLILRTPGHIDVLARRLAAMRLPVTVSVAQGAARSGRQNRLSHAWFTDIARQLGDRTADEVRAECKLAFGVPILCEENEPFRDQWTATFGALPWAARLAAVRTFDLPVTRLMTLPQMTRFLDAMQRHWLPMGVRLTDPETLKREEELT
jgi:hypothetical protein